MARFRAHTVVTGHRPTQAGRRRSITDRVTGTSRLASVVAVALATSMAVVAPVSAAVSVPAINGGIDFISGRKGNQEFYMINADGMNPVRRTTNLGVEGAPLLSSERSKTAASTSVNVCGQNNIHCWASHYPTDLGTVIAEICDSDERYPWTQWVCTRPIKGNGSLSVAWQISLKDPVVGSTKYWSISNVQILLQINNPEILGSFSAWRFSSTLQIRAVLGGGLTEVVTPSAPQHGPQCLPGVENESPTNLNLADCYQGEVAAFPYQSGYGPPQFSASMAAFPPDATGVYSAGSGWQDMGGCQYPCSGAGDTPLNPPSETQSPAPTPTANSPTPPAPWYPCPNDSAHCPIGVVHREDGGLEPIRNAPSVSASVIGWASNNTSIDIGCQTLGDSAWTDLQVGNILDNNRPYQTTVWDRIGSGANLGGYVSDAWIYTGTSEMVAPQC